MTSDHLGPPTTLLRILGAALVAGGLVLAVAAYVTGVEPSASGFVIPTLFGAEGIFLGGLAIWWSLPATRRQRIVPAQPRLVAVLTIWSLVCLAVLAGAAELLRGWLADAPPLARDVIAFVLAALLGFGVAIMGTGAVATLWGLAVLGVRGALARLRSRRPR